MGTDNDAGQAMSQSAHEIMNRMAQAARGESLPDLVVTHYQLTRTGTALPVLSSRPATPDPDATYHVDELGQVWRQDATGFRPMYVVDHPRQVFTPSSATGRLTPLLPLDVVDAAHAEHCFDPDIDQAADVDRQPADVGRHRLVISDERLHGARATYWAGLDQDERGTWLAVARDPNNAYNRDRHWTNVRCMACCHFPPCQCPQTGQYGTHTGLHSGNHYAGELPPTAHVDPWERRPYITHVTPLKPGERVPADAYHPMAGEPVDAHEKKEWGADTAAGVGDSPSFEGELVDAPADHPTVSSAVERWSQLLRDVPKGGGWALAGAVGETNSVCRSTGMAQEDDTQSEAWCAYAVEAYARIRGTEDTPEVPRDAE